REAAGVGDRVGVVDGRAERQRTADVAVVGRVLDRGRARRRALVGRQRLAGATVGVGVVGIAAGHVLGLEGVAASAERAVVGGLRPHRDPGLFGRGAGAVPRRPLVPYTTLFRSREAAGVGDRVGVVDGRAERQRTADVAVVGRVLDRGRARRR